MIRRIKNRQRYVKRGRNFGNSKDTAFSGRDNFRVTVFDHLLRTLQKTLEAYNAISDKFGFLLKTPLVNDDQLRDESERLVKTNPEDYNKSFPEEIVHLQLYLNEPEADVWLQQKGENKKNFRAFRML